MVLRQTSTPEVSNDLTIFGLSILELALHDHLQCFQLPTDPARFQHILPFLANPGNNPNLFCATIDAGGTYIIITPPGTSQ